MSKPCCRYHDTLMVATTGQVTECGLGGNGNPVVCCVSCPDIENYGLIRSVINYYKTEAHYSDDRLAWEKDHFIHE